MLQLKKQKKGNILTENIIFIILNLAFLSILIVFLFTKVGGAAVLEEKYAKQIALLIDSAEPGMRIQLNMEDAIGKARDEKRDLDRIVFIEDNIVNVQLREEGGSSYSFFNDVEVSVLDNAGKDQYIFLVDRRENG